MQAMANRGTSLNMKKPSLLISANYNENPS